MFSLYRAWFGDDITGENYPRLQETLSPPDTVVRVGNEGEHQFVAHKGVLAAHSGYLKALLATTASTSNSNVNSNFGGCTNLPATAIAVTTTNLSGQSTRQPVTSVSVSSIGGEAFAPLLHYMYTGRLEVTLDNVYSVLLATHLLHMPGALEQCRAALLRLRAPPPLPTPIPVPASTSTSTSMSMSTSASGSGNILRPIPNRLMVGPSMCWPPPTPLYPPTAPVPASVGIPHLPQLQPSVLMQSTVPPTISVLPTSAIHEAQNSARYSTSEVLSPKTSPSRIERDRAPRVDSRQRSPETESSTSLPFVAAAAAAFTAFATSNVATSATRVSSPSQSTSPAPSSTSESPTPFRRGKKTALEQRNKEERENSNLNSHGKNRGQFATSSEENSGRNREGNTDNSTSAENDRSRSSRRRGRGGSNSGNDSSSSGTSSVVYDVACCDGPVKFHRVLNENYSSQTSCGSSPIPPIRVQRQCLETESTSSENDENGGPGTARGTCDPIEPTADAANGTGSYTCGYCRHTFKSQYCYRKHAKRHLLPTRTNDTSGNRQRHDVARGRREVRLLDLNVQYYPCKICGCKFPSYYFVHKHRKMCHPNVEERPRADGTNNATGQDHESTASDIHETP